jgi:SsrA-binding protein
MPEYSIRGERTPRADAHASIKIRNQMYASATESIYYFIPSKNEAARAGISCLVAPPIATGAAFFKESRMKSPDSTKPTRKSREPVAAGERDAAVNRAAGHNYFLLDKFEAGIALRGTEVKSIREGQANLKDAYGIIKDGEAYLLNAHIGPYSHGNSSNHDSLRTRKLLLHRRELQKLMGKTQLKGLTLIPTRLYFRQGRVKCELAVAKGKQDWDKRETERRREDEREARAAIVRGQHK